MQMDVEMKPNTFYCGDALELARQLPDNYINCIITSPPYYGLRDYGISGQLGLESTYQEHIVKLVELFRELHRALRPDGTVWFNYGDCYATTQNGRSAEDTKAIGNDDRTFRNKPFSTVQGNLKPKNLMGMPWRIALALQDNGWILRSDIIWHKTNPMPESVKDRPTKAHEYIFLLSKSSNYWYDADAIREPMLGSTIQRYEYGWNGDKKRGWGKDGPNHNFDKFVGSERSKQSVESGRNKRSVWTIATQPYSEAHFATFPPKLIEPCVLAGCPPKVCSKCKMPYQRTINRIRDSIPVADRKGRISHNGRAPQTSGYFWDGPTTEATNEWVSVCACNAPVEAGIILDPFMGSGTVAEVAIKHSRQWIGYELNPKYIKLARNRIEGIQRILC